MNIPPIRRLKTGLYSVDDIDGRSVVTAPTLEEAIDLHKKIYGMKSIYTKRPKPWKNKKVLQ